jgi:hypothetical protein
MFTYKNFMPDFNAPETLACLAFRSLRLTPFLLVGELNQQLPERENP